MVQGVQNILPLYSPLSIGVLECFFPRVGKVKTLYKIFMKNSGFYKDEKNLCDDYEIN